jgi:hypothetical protein
MSEVAVTPGRFSASFGDNVSSWSGLLLQVLAYRQRKPHEARVILI